MVLRKGVFLALIVVVGCKTTSDQSGLSETPDPQIEANQAARIKLTVSDASSALNGALKVLGPNNLPVVSSEVLAQSKCIIAMQVDRGAILIGGSGGEGLMSCRLPAGGWSAPSFLRTGGIDLGASIGFERMQSAIFVSDEKLAKAWQSSGSFEIGTYAKAIAGDVTAALQSLNQFGVAVVQVANGGLYAGVGVSFSSLNHAQETRNQAVYGEVLGGGVPTDNAGRLCSTYLLPGRRNGCIVEWERKTGKQIRPVLSNMIFSMPVDAAPMSTKPFNDILRQIP
jgi:lipid-binding SYLF domain-containing protein